MAISLFLLVALATNIDYRKYMPQHKAKAPTGVLIPSTNDVAAPPMSWNSNQHLVVALMADGDQQLVEQAAARKGIECNKNPKVYDPNKINLIPRSNSEDLLTCWSGEKEANKKSKIDWVMNFYKTLKMY